MPRVVYKHPNANLDNFSITSLIKLIHKISKKNKYSIIPL
jgi:hypothetical protein